MTSPDNTVAAASSVVSDERIKEAFHKYGTGRPDGFAAAVRELLASAPPARAMQEQQAGVPAGHKLVPLEPTPEMIEAGRVYAECAIHGNAVLGYRAMLDAAPSAPPVAGDSVQQPVRMLTDEEKLDTAREHGNVGLALADAIERKFCQVNNLAIGAAPIQQAAQPEAQQAAPATLTDEQIKARCAAAGIQWIVPDADPDGYPGGFDMCTLAEMRALLSGVAAPAGASEPTEAQAYSLGAKGGPPSERERLLFEAWMRGHCWAIVGEWDGKQYVAASERGGGHLDFQAMASRRIWAAWRDRAALSAVAVAEPLTDERISELWKSEFVIETPVVISPAHRFARAVEAAHGIGSPSAKEDGNA